MGLAEELGISGLLPSVSGLGAGIWDVVVIMFWVFLIVGGLLFFLYWNSFKHTVLIREITSTRRFIVVDKAKIRRNKDDGVEYWYLRNRKIELVSPKPSSIEITKKGRFYAECYHDLVSGKSSGYSWINDDGQGDFISYPAETKALVTARLRRAAERRGRSVFDMIMSVAAITIPLIALIMVFAFWGDLTKATIDAQEGLEAAMYDFSQRVSNYSYYQTITANNPSYNPSIPLDQQVGGGGR